MKLFNALHGKGQIMGASIGAGLGVLVALLWGSVDIFVTIAARRIGTFRTTIISQASGMLALLICGYLVFSVRQHDFAFSTINTSIYIGALTGFCAAIGYYAFYYALEKGPIALTSPITASSSGLTFFLSTLTHRESASLFKMACLIIVIGGITLASTNIKELRQLLRMQRPATVGPGIYWAIAAMIAFGLMDFGIGVSASASGWFLPVLWTRLFSLVFLASIYIIKRLGVLKPSQRASLNSHGQSVLFPPGAEAYRIDYKQPVRFTDMRELATISLPALNTSAHTYVSTRPRSLRRTTMVPLVHPPPPELILERYQTSFPQNDPEALRAAPLQKEQGKKAKQTHIQLWLSLAIVAGIMENVAVLIFSLDTQIATIGIASAITSSYSLVGALFGVTFYHERLKRNQFCGIILCILGIFLLAI